jgi:hypothetical protein|tara:strand:- start:146 stop:487 length:342 start_codon:yes stop_codon:yes gene_type:complete
LFSELLSLPGLASAVLESVALESAFLESVVLGSVVLGSVVLGSVVLGSGLLLAEGPESVARRLAVTVAVNSSPDAPDGRAAVAADASIRAAFVSALCIRDKSGVFIVHLIGAD